MASKLELLKPVEDKIFKVIDEMSRLEQLISYKLLYNLDFRISNIEAEIRKEVSKIEPN